MKEGRTLKCKLISTLENTVILVSLYREFISGMRFVFVRAGAGGGGRSLEWDRLKYEAQSQKNAPQHIITTDLKRKKILNKISLGKHKLLFTHQY